MPFPKSERVIYDKNPLVNVICQFRYPPILRIDSEIPASFQQEIQSAFPLYEEKQELQPEFTNLNFGLPFQQMPNTLITKNHEFASVDGISKINLTRTFLSISCTAYEKWETFKTFIDIGIDALQKVYNPPFYTRLGIRYIDVISRSNLNLEGYQWNKLLNPAILGVLSSEISESVESFENVSIIDIPSSQAKIRIYTSFVVNQMNNEKCIQIDSDFYHSYRLNQSETVQMLNFLHDSASRLIRWAITNDLHEAMQPNIIK